MTTDGDELLAERLKEHGLRVTPQRLAIYRALVATAEHPTAQMLYERLHPALPSLSQATVYNSLQALVACGLVHELGDAGDGALHYDADLSPHLNLVCTCCHRIEDFFDPSLALVDSAVNSTSGYRIMGARLVYYGLCAACQAAPAGAASTAP